MGPPVKYTAANVATWASENTEADPNGGCWLWSGSEAGKYGKTRFGGKPMLAHRASWEVFKGAIPPGLYVCHKCDVPKCVNPNHLFLGTAKQNTADMMSKSRWAGGEKMKKISPSDVSVIAARRNGGERAVALSAEYGVSERYIRLIAKGLRGQSHVI